MFFSRVQRMTTRRRLVPAFAVLGLVSAAVLVPATSAVAAVTSDLSVTQAISTTGASGEVTMTVTVHNAGPSDASNLAFTGQVKTNSSSVGVGVSGSAACFITGRTPGYKLQFICDDSPTITSGSNWVLTVDLFGTTGDAVTQVVTVGAGSSGDPNLDNNTSSVKSYFGPAADKAIADSVSSNGPAGTRKINTTITNKGPSPATALVTHLDVLAPGITSINYDPTLPTTCNIVATDSGFTVSVECDTAGPLALGAKLKIGFTYHGPSGGPLKVVITTSSAETDPVSTNNTVTTTSTFI